MHPRGKSQLHTTARLEGAEIRDVETCTRLRDPQQEAVHLGLICKIKLLEIMGSLKRRVSKMSSLLRHALRCSRVAIWN